MVDENYKDTYSERFKLGSEKRMLLYMDLKLQTKLENLFLNVNVNYIKFTNAGIKIIGDYLHQGIDFKNIVRLWYFTIFQATLINLITTFFNFD